MLIPWQEHRVTGRLDQRGPVCQACQTVDHRSSYLAPVLEHRNATIRCLFLC